VSPGIRLCPAQRQAFLHPFAAGQKDVVWRDETRRFCLSEKAQVQLIQEFELDLSRMNWY